jgi:CHAT domain-containing protein
LDFRDFVEPLYRQFIELQLSLEKPFTLISASQTNFDTALKTLDALRLAELQNYFGNNCQLILSPLSFNSQSTRSTNQNTTAIFSSVIFDKKTAIVVQYPNGNKQLNWINEEKGEIIETLADFRNRLGDASNADSQEHYYFGNAKQIYQWVITPFREQLQAAGVDTLVFIQDGIFRNIPMAALYDDNSQFLVQNYTIVTAPSVSISESKPFDWKTSRVLALGLSGSVVEVGGRKLDPLDGVKREIESLREVFPDNGNNTLENSNFTRKRMQERLAQRSYQIIQIGTHANFGTDSQNTYLVMGDGTRLQINELNQILRSAAQENPFELMVLTACKTADGNDRVVLGLAGVAAQTGTRRVLATLWSVEDDSTSTLISQFYKDLYNTGMSPAEVLQQAQKHLLNEDDPKLKKYKHPYYWAPYILIGDWR